MLTQQIQELTDLLSLDVVNDGFLQPLDHVTVLKHLLHLLNLHLQTTDTVE